MNAQFDPDFWILKTDEMTGFVAVGEEPAAPKTYELSLSVMPNPANPLALASFDLPTASHVELTIYDVTGRRVETLASDYLQAGTHQFRWNARGIASGIYLVCLHTPGQTLTKKLTVLK
jgi:hypothetical protein